MAVPLLAIRIGHAHLKARALNVAEHVEERRLAARTILLALHGCIDDVLGVVLIHKVHHLAPRIPRGVEGACLDERFDHATVSLARVHALDKVVQRLKRAARLALGDNRLRHAGAHAADAGQTKAHALLGSRELGTGLVDIWRQHGDAVVTARRDVVNDLVGLARVGRQNGRHVLVRIVRLEPCRLHNQDGVAGGVRLVKGVGRELENIVPNLLGDLARVVVLDSAVHPVVVGGLVRAILPVEHRRREQLDLFLSHGLTDTRVRFALGEAAHLDGDEHNLLLVDHGAVGFAQDVVQTVVVGDGRFLAVHTVDIGRNHAGAQRARAVQSDQCHDVLVLGGLHVLDRGRHAGGLDLEDAGGVAGAHELKDLGIVKGNLFLFDVDAEVLFDVGLGLRDNRQRAQAQEVHLEQAHVGNGMALVLGNLDAALGVELGGHVLVDGVAADQNGARVHALATGEALNRERRVDDAAGVVVLFIGLGKVGVKQILFAGLLFEHLLELDLGVARDHLGQALAHVDRVVQDARGVVDGLLGLNGRVGDDVGDLLGAVELANVLHDLEAPLIVEVHIDIGHLGTLRGQEPLEHQAVLERVERGDVHGVGDDSAGGRATAGADADAVVLGPLHVLGNDQKVGGKALVADDLVFVLKALFDVDATDLARGPVVTVVLAQALLALAAELALVRLAGIEQREARQDDGVPVQLNVALVGDLERVVAGLGAIREHRPHLLLGLHVKLRAGHAHAVRVVDLGVHANAHDDVLHGRVLAAQVVEVVGGDDLDAHLLGDVDERAVHLLVGQAVVGGDAVFLDLDVEVAGLEGVTEGLGPLDGALHVTAVDVLGDDARDAGARADHALGVAAQVVERHARLVVKALHGGLGNRLHQVDVALLVLGQKDHVVELGLVVASKGLVRRKVDLAAKDGFDDQGRLELVDVALLVPHGHVLHILGMLARVFLGIGLHQLVAAVLFQEGLVVAPGFVLGRVVVDGVAGQRQVGHAIHVAVVGNGHGGHAQLNGTVDHILDTGCAVEHGKDSVVVQMDECHVMSSDAGSCSD